MARTRFQIPAAVAETFLQTVMSVCPSTLVPESVSNPSLKLTERLKAATEELPAVVFDAAVNRAFPLPVFPLGDEVYAELDKVRNKAAAFERERYIPIEETETHIVVVTPVPWDELSVRTAVQRECSVRGGQRKRIVVGWCSEDFFMVACQRMRIDDSEQRAEGDRLAKDLAASAEHIAVLDLYNTSIVVNQVLRPVFEDAVERGASDIHFQPDVSGDGETIILRQRVRSGWLEEFNQGGARDGRIWADLLKNFFVTQCRIQEVGQRADGKFRVKVKKSGFADPVVIDVRFASLRSSKGQHVTLRLLDRTKKLPTFSQLYEFAPEVGEWTVRFMNSPSGIMLVCGATGAGKTTTLSTVLREMPTDKENIYTIEDPVEYEIAGISQFSIEDLRVGLPESKNPWLFGLESILRKDPDVIMVGEIRDEAVAVALVQFAVTGHQVFSTLHNESVTSLYERLHSMGIDDAAMAYSTKLVTAQRMVHRLCHCAHTVSADSLEQAEVALRERNLPIEWSQALLDGRCRLRHAAKNNSCPSCGGRGYHGVMVAMEGFDFSDSRFHALRASADSANRKLSPFEMQRFAEEAGWPLLPHCVLRMVYAGQTDADGAARAVDYFATVQALNSRWETEKTPSKWRWDMRAKR